MGGQGPHTPTWMLKTFLKRVLKMGIRNPGKGEFQKKKNKKKREDPGREKEKTGVNGLKRGGE